MKFFIMNLTFKIVITKQNKKVLGILCGETFTGSKKSGEL